MESTSCKPFRGGAECWDLVLYQAEWFPHAERVANAQSQFVLPLPLLGMRLVT